MIYIGLLIGIFVGSCVTVIVLVLFKDISLRKNSQKVSFEIVKETKRQLKEEEALPPFITPSPDVEKEKCVSNAGR